VATSWRKGRSRLDSWNPRGSNSRRSNLDSIQTFGARKPPQVGRQSARLALDVRAQNLIVPAEFLVITFCDHKLLRRRPLCIICARLDSGALNGRYC
jgi:hypothetical protein